MLWQYGEITRRKLIIVGAGEFAEIAYEYFTHDSPYEVVGFAVERAFLKTGHLCGLPVVALEEMQSRFPPNEHSFFVAVTYTQLNRVRTRLFARTREFGYSAARYVSSRAFVWHNVTVGESVFVFENNVVQHRAELGDGVILWSGNHIGHRARIGRFCYLASHVVVSGYTAIGESCFVGVNATIADNVSVGRDCLIGAGAVILKDVPDDSIHGSTMTPRSPVGSRRFHKIPQP